MQGKITCKFKKGCFKFEKVITLVIAMILVVSVTACSSSKGETVATVEGTKISSDEFKNYSSL